MALVRMQSVRARLRLLAAGVLSNTHRQSEEDDSRKEEVTNSNSAEATTNLSVEELLHTRHPHEYAGVSTR